MLGPITGKTRQITRRFVMRSKKIEVDEGTGRSELLQKHNSSLYAIAVSATLSLMTKLFVRAIFSAWRRDQREHTELLIVWLHYSIVTILTRASLAWLVESTSNPRLPITGDALVDSMTLISLIDIPMAAPILASLDAVTTALVWGTRHEWQNLASYGANDMSFSGSIVFILWWLTTGEFKLCLASIVRRNGGKGPRAPKLVGLARDFWRSTCPRALFVG